MGDVAGLGMHSTPVVPCIACANGVVGCSLSESPRYHSIACANGVVGKDSNLVFDQVVLAVAGLLIATTSEISPMSSPPVDRHSCNLLGSSAHALLRSVRL